MNTEHLEKIKAAVEPHGQLLLVSLVGSRAYGTDNDGSDWDYKGVYVEPLSDTLDIRRKAHFPKPIQVDGLDAVIYELGHFCHLAAGGNPTVQEVLWSPRMHIPDHADGHMLLDARTLFLSRQMAKSYHGFARSEAKEASKLPEGKKRTKKMMHALRVASNGMHAMVQRKLTVRVEHPDILMTTAAGVNAEAAVEFSLQLLDDAVALSSLPDEPRYSAINETVYRIRMNQSKEHMYG